MATQKSATPRSIEEEIDEIDAALADLTRERLGLPETLSWGELEEAGALKKLEERETRRGIIPRLQQAARVRRLELQIAKHERDIEPLNATQEETWDRLQEVRAEMARLKQEEVETYNTWHAANVRMQTHQARIREARRELNNLQAAKSDG